MIHPERQLLAEKHTMPCSLVFGFRAIASCLLPEKSGDGFTSCSENSRR